MSDTKMTNIPSMNINSIITTLSDAYCAIINAGQPLKLLPSVMLWGPPGVGKSQAVAQLAKEIEDRTGKTTAVTDVRLLLFNPIDLRGIPTANEDKTLAIWLKPQIFQMDPDEGMVNILFLDEISAAPQSVQAAAYQITLDRKVGEHKLPDNCIVIAAGNRTTDRSVAFKMPKALANRLMHFEADGSFAAWKQWAVRNGVHPKVVGFLSFRQNYLMNFDGSSEELAFATPRSWEMVSNILNHVSDDLTKVHQMVAGLVGVGVAVELRKWDTIYKDLPSLEDIFNGKKPPVPKQPDALYALTAAMTAYAKDHKEELDLIANSILYAQKFPPDFAAMLLKDYLYIEKGYKQKLMQIPAFSRWLTTQGRLLNGII